ncbi:DEAD/DEAH box helicase [Neolewinella aurantiaca]|uniref:DEAD/DEAH box helicase n=1 Tax=Neolewinella aurantiaca TaxID=2602767 RepID=A0A5C7FQT9_9BACT|nr:DEAD/DEAH box helicase [Neolewinella aurantiaca]TXF87065.1 DEAD/DEAH box helicase [Neolewinella aurantiaca]
MTPSLPISDHESHKKTLLVQSREELILLLTILLSDNSSDSYELEKTLRLANEQCSTIGKWSRAGISKIFGKLNRGGFAYESYRSMAVTDTWRIPLFFSADALRPEELDAIVNAVTRIKRLPQDGSQGHSWHIRYNEIKLRILHKILLNKERDFVRLYSLLSDARRYYEDPQRLTKQAVDEVLTVLDWQFWQKRSGYFQWLHFNSQQFNYEEWHPDTPARLLPLIKELNQTEDAEEYSEDTRSVVMLGMHFFKDFPDDFRFDPGLQAVAHLLQGDTSKADAAFTKMTNPEREANIIDVIALARAFGSGQITKEELEIRASKFRESSYPLLINCFLAYVFIHTGRVETGEKLLEKQLRDGPTHALEWMVALWCVAWTGMKPRQTLLRKLFSDIEEDSYIAIPWVKDEILNSLTTIFPHHEKADMWKEKASTQVQGKFLMQNLLPVKEPWEYALRLLAQSRKGKHQDDEKGPPQFRTVWVIDFENEEIFCKEQKLGKSGWSKGRKMKWYELITPKNPETMDPADGNAVNALKTIDGRRLSGSMIYNDDSLYVDFGRMLHEIADHPRIYLGDKKRIPIELIRSEPELQITETPNGLLMRFDPPVEAHGYVWRKETPTRYRVYQLSEEQGKIAWAIGHGIEVPDTQRERVEAMVEDIRPTVSVQSTFDLIDEDLEQVQGSTMPCIHLLPFGDGYQVAVYVKPIPEEPIYFKPGDGLPRTVVVLEEGRKLLIRDFKEEIAEIEATLEACPTLNRIEGSYYEYTIEDTQTALRILLELRALVQEQLISIEHPKGEKLKIVGTASSDELAIKVGKSRDWFEVDGKLTVNEERVLDLEMLLEHMKNRDENQFIELKDGEFVALTDELRDRVLEMEGLLHKKGKKFQLPTLAASAFEEMADGLEDLEFDDAWTESLERIKKAESIRPRVPKSFRAELRDYQKDGFKWLMRLAEWGVGGCLADDMGLGKTIQALAMLSARSKKGPALVIAPASVTRNWQAETERFAPDLVPVLIASRSDLDLLPQLGTGDLALVSYGLLSFIGDELQAIDWATIVLDEAQAIKNTATKRAKIVQNLSADFKLATTGTPIENHLGELWSLFRFLNPGLLSGKTAFNEKFNRPISRDGNEERRETLKNLVKPFILRRRKDQVLTELPPKTEIVLSVDLSDEEKALYEAMRRQALKDIAAADEQQKRFTVLAQLTKLRQAACHPRLVRPNSKIGSAKLELVGETLLEILENGHKALIFSQFVKHLKIVENWVKGQGIEYQYLDGSTPGKKREESVDAFQNGEGKVFLISLKAGGTGLNLTEADYVLHLDPWWNPAAEDQASDRAHRIGQQRPVTVYRFVSEGTIEEQIIALHKEKRDLADQILSGTGKAGKLGVDEILDMIKDA